MFVHPSRPFSDRAHCHVAPVTLPLLLMLSPSENVGGYPRPHLRLRRGQRHDPLLLHVEDGHGNRSPGVDCRRVFDVAIGILSVMHGDLKEQQTGCRLKVQRLGGPQFHPVAVLHELKLVGMCPLDAERQAVIVAVSRGDRVPDGPSGVAFLDILRA